MGSNFLKVSVVWFDDGILELELQASNESFKGRTNFYAAHDACTALAAKFDNFPRGRDDVRMHEFGGDDLPGYGAAQIRVRTQDALGHLLVQVDMHWISAFAKDVPQSAAIRLYCTPVDLDGFVEQLQNMSLEVGQSAVLMGQV